MKLTQLLSNIDCKIIGKKNRNVSHLSNVAEDCKNESLFFALRGKQNTGTDYVREAAKKGAKVIVTTESVPYKRITQVIVPDDRKAMSQIAANFYGNPARNLKIIGVTGTNGKTTVTTLTSHILSKKYNVATIGTNGATIGGKTYQTNMTTPDPILLHSLLAKMVESRVEYVVMEFSAHAIYYQKLWDVMPDIIAFTNLSEDHLDFFENMDKYFDAKAQIFKDGNYNKSVVCTDTDFGKKLVAFAKNCTTCSTREKADIFITESKHTKVGEIFSVNAEGKSNCCNSTLFGSFNLQNMIVAFAICKCVGMTSEEIISQIESFGGVEGRYQTFHGKCLVVLDYAHTPDGLEKLLVSVRQTNPKSKIICVFGCGGNRDTAKRAIMGAVAEKYADKTIVTTDNPRYEDNHKIATDIIAGFTKKKWQMILDRGQAIREAIDNANKTDIVVIAGKGAEQYIEVQGTKLKYSDKQIIVECLNK